MNKKKGYFDNFEVLYERAERLSGALEEVRLMIKSVAEKYKDDIKQAFEIAIPQVFNRSLTGDLTVDIFSWRNHTSFTVLEGDNRFDCFLEKDGLHVAYDATVKEKVLIDKVNKYLDCTTK